MEIILFDLWCFGLDTRVQQSEHGPLDKNALKGCSFSDFLMASFAEQEFVFDSKKRVN